MWLELGRQVFFSDFNFFQCFVEFRVSSHFIPLASAAVLTPSFQCCFYLPLILSLKSLASYNCFANQSSFVVDTYPYVIVVGFPGLHFPHMEFSYFVWIFICKCVHFGLPISPLRNLISVLTNLLCLLFLKDHDLFPYIFLILTFQFSLFSFPLHFQVPLEVSLNFS